MRNDDGGMRFLVSGCILLLLVLSVYGAAFDLSTRKQLYQKIHEKANHLEDVDFSIIRREALRLEPTWVNVFMDFVKREAVAMAYLLNQWEFWYPHMQEILARRRRKGKEPVSLSHAIADALYVEVVDYLGMLPYNHRYLMYLKGDELSEFIMDFMREFNSHPTKTNVALNESLSKVINRSFNRLSWQERRRKALNILDISDSISTKDKSWNDLLNLEYRDETSVQQWIAEFRKLEKLLFPQRTWKRPINPDEMPGVTIRVLQKWRDDLARSKNAIAKPVLASLLTYGRVYSFIGKYWSPAERLDGFLVRLLVARDGLNEFAPDIYNISASEIMEQYGVMLKINDNIRLGDCLLSSPDLRWRFIAIIRRTRGLETLQIPPEIKSYRALREFLFSRSHSDDSITTHSGSAQVRQAKISFR